MDKKQIDEFLRLDMKIDQEYDGIRNNGNKQWRLRNEILKLGQETTRKENKIIDLSETQMRASIPIGFMPSKKHIDAKKNHSSLGLKEEYEVNELKLENKGDMCVLSTDGLEDHFGDSFRETLEGTLRDAKDLTSKGIYNRVKRTIYDHGKPEDDISYVIIKKNK
ncbi:hypothetical protein LCGC14_2645010 [marine sediment metagenome]|uniref:PPM-type phosphatase domain-containing protein n=1 Tax=marine sediment metagenome TaxID=412755 RepID=A0A0F8ZWG6_9ZZZZ